MAKRRRFHKRRQRGGVGPDSQSLEEKIRSSQTDQPQPPPPPPPDARFQPPPEPVRALREDPNVTAPQTPQEIRRDELMRQRTERGRIAREAVTRRSTDEKLSDIQAREGPKEATKSRFQALVSDKVKDVSIPKAASQVREAAKDPGFQKILEGETTALTIASLPAQIATPESLPLITFQESQAKGESVGKSLGEAGKTLPFALAGTEGRLSTVARTAALGEIGAKVGTDVDEGKPAGDTIGTAALGLASIIPEGKTTGKAFSELSRSKKALRVVRESAIIGKEAKELHEALNVKPKPVETDEEATTRVLNENPKDKKYTTSQLAAIKRHVDTTGYEPNANLQKQLDLFGKDTAIAKTLNENRNTVFTPGQLKNIKAFIKRNPGFNMSETLGRQIDADDKKAREKPVKVPKKIEHKFIPKPKPPVKRSVQKESESGLAFKKFMENIDVDSVQHILPLFVGKKTTFTRSPSGLVVKEIDCSKLVGKEKVRCEHNRKKEMLKTKISS